MAKQIEPSVAGLARAAAASGSLSQESHPSGGEAAKSAATDGRFWNIRRAIREIAKDQLISAIRDDRKDTRQECGHARFLKSGKAALLALRRACPSKPPRVRPNATPEIGKAPLLAPRVADRSGGEAAKSAATDGRFWWSICLSAEMSKE